MDKRIRLTAKQKTLIKRLRELLTKMKEEKVGILFDKEDGSLFFYNKSEVVETKGGCFIGSDYNEWYVNDGKVWITPDWEELEKDVVRIPDDAYIDGDGEEQWFELAVEPSTKEEIEALHKEEEFLKDYKRKNLQTTIAECEAEKQKYLKKIEDTVNSDGLPQKGKDYQKQLYTNLINELDVKIANAQKELAEL